MIVLFNPWSTPSPKKPLPMSLLAVGSMLEGEFDYRIVDGNVDADPVGAIVDARRCGTPLTAIGVTVMPGPQLRARGVGLPAAEARAAARADRLGRLLSLAARGRVPERSDRRLSASAGRASRRFSTLMRALRDGGSLVVDRRPDLSRARRDSSQRRRAADAARRAAGRGRTTGCRWSATSTSTTSGTASATHHSSFGCPFACSFCAVVGMANRKWVAQSPERVGAVLEKFSTHYGADAVQFHDMDFFISEPRTQAIAERLAPLGMTWWALGRVDELMRYKAATWDGDEAQRAEDGVLRRRVGIDRHAEAHEQGRHGVRRADARSRARA